MEFQHNSRSVLRSYRPEIDGLRALAVVAVIINHFNKELLPSGYLGVDIFFVISGYVITSSLATRKSKNLLDFMASFYERRLKRLIPAMAVFVIITSILISLFNPAPFYALKTGIASLFGVSNIYLFRQSTDYFAETTTLNPFTHTWSLGVEEQFYLVFPFILWFSGFSQQKRHGARYLALALLIPTIASFITFVYLNQINQAAAYFLMPPRFWEMAIGSFSFIIFDYLQYLKDYLRKISTIFIIAIMLLIMLLPVNMAVLSTCSIVILTSLLIGCLKEKSLVFHFLTRQGVVYIGLISYSLYLWHWTVLSISRWTIGIHWWSVPIQLLAMLLLAHFSYKFIEEPFRRGSLLANKKFSFLISLGLLAFSASLLTFLNLPLQKYAYVGRRVPKSILDSTLCKNPGPSDSGILVCNFIPAKYKRTFWVLGDSHAAMLFEGAVSVFKDTKWRVVLYTAGGTPFPPLGHYRKTEMNNDLRKLDYYYSIEKLLRSKLGIGDVVAISMRLPYHFGGTYYEYPASDFVFLDSKGKQTTQKEYFQNWQKRVSKLAAAISPIKIVIFSPTPEWRDAVMRQCVEQKEWFNGLSSSSNCKIKRSFFVGESGLYKPILDGLHSLQKENSNILIFNSFDVLCPGRVCSFGIKGKASYIDDDHINPDSSRLVMRKFYEYNRHLLEGTQP